MVSAVSPDLVITFRRVSRGSSASRKLPMRTGSILSSTTRRGAGSRAGNGVRRAAFSESRPSAEPPMPSTTRFLNPPFIRAAYASMPDTSWRGSS